MRLGSRGRLALAATALGLVGAQATASPAAGRPLADDGYGTDSWWYQAMGLTEAHKISTGKGVTIAVIDGPVDPTVPELRGQKVQPVKSFCAGGPTATGKLADHGTRVTVNLVGNGKGTAPGGVGVAGIAPDANVRTYSVDDSPKAGLQCARPGDAVAQALALAVSEGARVVSMSVGSETLSQGLEAALLKAFINDVVVVAAAGQAPEAQTVPYPAAYPGVVSVAAVDRDAKPWKLNVPGNREAFVISAAGVDVRTGAFDGNRWRSDANVSGTSEATPLVAGGLALVRAKYPEATASQVIQNLIRNPGGTRTFGKDLETGYGIMSVPKMLASDPTQWPDENPLVDLAAAARGTIAPATPSAGQMNGSAVSASGDADSGGGGSSVGLIAGGLGALAAIGAAVAFALSRRRGAPGSGHG